MPGKSTPKYQRILLKLSGEALGGGGVGINPAILDQTALEIGQLVGIGVQVGLVIGGGNLFRGAELSEAGRISRKFCSGRPKAAAFRTAGRKRKAIV